MSHDALTVACGLLIPFVGTAIGSLCALLMRRGLNRTVERALTGFAAGVMVAASVWSLIVPSLERALANGMGAWAFVPAVVGFWAGTLFLLVLDHVIPHLHMNTDEPEGPQTAWRRTTKLVLAVVIHNIPEGMAVGVVWAAWLAGQTGISATAAVALSVGIAIQNAPEGAIVSMPLRANGMGVLRACGVGVLSGAVEPLGALLAIAAAGAVVPAMPYLLAFAAGAMVYVVVEELIPEMSAGGHSNVGTVLFTAGFTLMLALDVALG